VRRVAPCAYPRYATDGTRIDPDSKELPNPPGARGQPPEAYNGYLANIERAELAPVIAAVRPLREIVEAQQAFLDKRHMGKIILVP